MRFLIGFIAGLTLGFGLTSPLLTGDGDDTELPA